MSAYDRWLGVGHDRRPHDDTVERFEHDIREIVSDCWLAGVVNPFDAAGSADALTVDHNALLRWLGDDPTGCDPVDWLADRLWWDDETVREVLRA